MYVQQHEGQQILVPKGPVRRELKLTQILRKKEEERRGRKGERNVEMGDRVGDRTWEMGGDGRQEKREGRRQKPSKISFPLFHN